jgi:DNA-binding transcriptional LysR family regulator
MIMAVSPPRPKDLPLNALKAFEAAARLGGFAAAAQELGVTSGAVTAHVKTLEALLGAALFERTARGVELNNLGKRVLPGFVEAFDALGEAVQTLRAEAAPRTVHIATLPSIAQLWLSPRLPALREAAPDISISITAMEEPPNLKRAPYDLCLFYGEDRQGALARDVIFPVCAPTVAQRLRIPADLAAATCISDATWASDWALWAAVAVPGEAFSPRGPIYSLYTLAVAEAVNGAGVLIGHESLVSDHLRRGELVAPFDVRVTLDRHLRLWSNRPLAKGSAAARVSAWLKRSSLTSATAPRPQAGLPEQASGPAG